MCVTVFMKKKTPADIVIETFDGISKLAKILGHENPSTVQGWKERGVIPSRQQPIVYAAAQREGKFLTLAQIMGVAE